MYPFHESSIHAAFRADFLEHLPFTEEELQRLRHAPNHGRTFGVVSGLRALFGRFRYRGERSDVRGLGPFTPPF